jgi:hypothetical protein
VGPGRLADVEVVVQAGDRVQAAVGARVGAHHGQSPQEGVEAGGGEVEDRVVVAVEREKPDSGLPRQQGDGEQ